MPKSVDSLIVQAESHLEECGYAEFTKWEYRKAWEEFAAHCFERGQALVTRQDGEVFTAGREWLADRRPKRVGAYARAVRCLFDFDENGAFATRPRPKAAAPDQWAGVLDGYLEVFKARGVAAKTVEAARGRLVGFFWFLAGLGVKDVASINAESVHRFAASLKGAPTTRAGCLYAVRACLRFLVQERGADPALGVVFPVILANRDAVLPSVYTADEVARVAEAAGAGRPSGRRDRAVVLLAALLGMRAGDIKALTLDQIDWAGKRLSFAQQKTGRRIDLPLPDECLFAVLDYLRHERATSADPHVFIRARAPFGPPSDSYTFHEIITNCFARAGIDVAGRHHGAHALRHSAAANMLLSNTPYPVISGVLGHASANTTRRYLRVDVEHLRPLSLEVPGER